MTREQKIEEIISRAKDLWISMLDSKVKLVHKLVMNRFDMEQHTDGSGEWDDLSDKYVNYQRMFPNLPILVQSGKLRDSIYVEYDYNPESGTNFFKVKGSKYANFHNSGQKVAKGGYPARRCLECPPEYTLDGFLLKKLQSKWVKGFLEIVRDVKSK